MEYRFVYLDGVVQYNVDYEMDCQCVDCEMDRQ